jgi:hypothetical protein
MGQRSQGAVLVQGGDSLEICKARSKAGGGLGKIRGFCCKKGTDKGVCADRLTKYGEPIAHDRGRSRKEGRSGIERRKLVGGKNRVEGSIVGDGENLGLRVV